MKISALLCALAIGPQLAGCGDVADLGPEALGDAAAAGGTDGGEDGAAPLDDPDLGSLSQALTTTLIYELFSESGSLVTNEYATHNPSHAESVLSPLWLVTSGTLYRKSGTGWSGVPDDIKPNALSTNGNRSAIFRMVSRRTDVKNARMKLKLRTNAFRQTPSTPAHTYDGVHLFLRYASEEKLYAVTVHRRDGHIVFKKKVPGGTTNGGTYYELAPYVTRKVPIGTWETVEARVQNLSSGVRLQLYVNGVLVKAVIDDGKIGGAPLTAAGRVGIRGDNADFQVDSISVSTL